MATDMISCTKCGHSNDADAHDCEQCGVTLQLVAAKQEHQTSLDEEPVAPATDEPATSENNMACPKCGQQTKALADDCIQCGVIFAKFYEAETQRLQEDPERAEELEQLKQTMEDHHNLRLPGAPDSIPATDETPSQEVAEEQDEIQSAIEDAQETREIPLVSGDTASQALEQLLRPKHSLQRLLKSYCDQIVGMNVDSPTAIKDVRLISANEDYFSVLAEESQLVCSFPMANIVSITEGVDGVPAGPAKSQTHYHMIIRVSHRMV